MEIVLDGDEVGYLVWPEGEPHQRGLAPEERRTSSPVSPHIWENKVRLQNILTSGENKVRLHDILTSDGKKSWVTQHSLGYQTLDALTSAGEGG